MKAIARTIAATIAALLIVVGVLACGVRIMSDLALREAEMDAQLEEIRLALSADVPVATTIVSPDAEPVTYECPLEDDLSTISDEPTDGSSDESTVKPDEPSFEDAKQDEMPSEVPVIEATSEQQVQGQPQTAYTDSNPAQDEVPTEVPTYNAQQYQQPQSYQEQYVETYYEQPVYPSVPDAVPGTAGMNDDELSLAREIFDSYNQFRASMGLNLATWDGTCAEMAVGSAKGCAYNRKLIHRLGIPADCQTSYSDILQFATWRMEPQEAVGRWAESNGHWHQMMCPTVKNAACGVYEEYGVYWFAIVYTFEGTNIG